jgi:cbb3-type cytochrome oxidase maturation protein
MIAEMTQEKQLLITWIAFSAAAFVGVAAFFIWAVRSGQFSQQDRARSLPLESGIPEKKISRELHELRE